MIHYNRNNFAIYVLKNSKQGHGNLDLLSLHEIMSMKKLIMYDLTEDTKPYTMMKLTIFWKVLLY